jgi:protein O-GlcNAc transferase
MGLERFAEAETPLHRAVELAPDKAEAHRDLGEILAKLERFDEAVASYRRALDLNPAFAQAHYNLGNALKNQGKLSEAIACFERAVELDPDDTGAMATWFRERQNLCSWSGFSENDAKVRQAIPKQPSILAPFTLLALSSSAEEQLACSRQAAATIVARGAVLPPAKPGRGERIRLGYLSADFRSHAVGF